jgi:predicted secreted acid phosphatase
MIARKRPHRFGNEVRHQIGLCRWVGALAIVLGAALVPVVVSAAECPVPREPSVPPADSIATPDKPIAKGFNIDTYKRQLTEYHDSGKYVEDIAAVMRQATRHVLRRASEVKSPAVVLDIDETSLSNWDNIKADDFGFIAGGTCPLPLQKNMPCGFDAWIDQADAPAIEPTRDFFNALRGDKNALKNLKIEDTENLNDQENIAVFFITGRREKQRRATLWNLDSRGFNGWAEVITRPNTDRDESIVAFKSGERDKIKSGKRGKIANERGELDKIVKPYDILANIGDQDSDLKDANGKTAECVFKVPNPYYFIR